MIVRASIILLTGIILVIKPDVFKAGQWQKTSVAQQATSPKSYRIIMRVFGIIAIIAGAGVILFEANIFV